ncbi:hypothetical protein JCM5353_001012 [Sporobolomyces roseus]
MEQGVIDPSLLIVNPQIAAWASDLEIPHSEYDPSGSENGSEELESTTERQRQRRSNDDKDEDYSPNITRQSSRSSTKSSSPPQTPAASFQVQIALLVLSQLSGLPSGHYSIDWSIVGVELVGHSQTARQLQANWKNWKQELHQIGSYVDLKWTHQEDDALRLAVEEISPTGEDDHYKVDNGDENVAKWLLVRDRLGEKDQACLENIVKRWKYLSGREPSKGIEESGLYSVDPEQISTGGLYEGTLESLDPRLITESSQQRVPLMSEETEVSPREVFGMNKNQDSLSYDGGRLTPSQPSKGWPGKKFTEEEDQELWKLARKGFGNYQIAKIMGRARSSIRGRRLILEKRGLSQPQTNPIPTRTITEDAPAFTVSPAPSTSLPALPESTKSVPLASAPASFSRTFLDSSEPLSVLPEDTPALAAFPFEADRIANLQQRGVLPLYDPPSPTIPNPVSSTTIPANVTPLPPHITSNSEPAYRFWSQAEDATLCQMLSEGSFHKDIAKVLSRSIVAIDQRVAKLRGKGVLPQLYCIGRPPSTISGEVPRSTPRVVATPSLRQIIDDTTPVSSLPLTSTTSPVSIDQIPFSPEDDREILRLHIKYPGHFKKISRQMQPTRHKKEVRERYEELSVARRERSSSPDSSSDDDRSARQASRASTFASRDFRLGLSTINSTNTSSRSPIPARTTFVKRESIDDDSTEIKPLPSQRPRKRQNDLIASEQSPRPRKVGTSGQEHLGPALAALKELYEFGEQGLIIMEEHKRKMAALRQRQ